MSAPAAAATFLAALAVLLGASAMPRSLVRSPRECDSSREQENGPLPWLRRRARRGPSPGAVALWADDLSRHLRGGVTLREAVRVVEPADPLLHARTERMRLAIEHGGSLDDAVARSPEDEGRPSPHLDLLRVLITACAQVGGSAAEPLDRGAAILRARAAALEERAAHSAQALLSGRVMTLLPIASLILLAATDGDVRDVLRTTAGLMCLGLGAAANATGWWWMRRIIGGPR